MKQFKIKLIPAAYNDLKEARTWYRKINPALSKRFNTQLKIAIDRIRSMPAVHAVRYKEVRIANLSVFPYAIHYITEADIIVVLAVHHTAIDPERWKERLKKIE